MKEDKVTMVTFMYAYCQHVRARIFPDLLDTEKQLIVLVFYSVCFGSS